MGQSAGMVHERIMTDPTRKRVIIFDIDGTLANVDHRVHHLHGRNKDWGAFFAAADADRPHDEIAYLNRMLAADPHNVVLIVTGRPERQRAATLDWLERHGIRFDAAFFRPTNDRREDSQVKGDILEQIIADYGMPYLVFEDRARVVDMWRSHGIRCLQVDVGDF
jgi:FMN phosphatase YigB (HAD superfamily)